MLLDTSRNVFWTNYRRRKRVDALSKHIVELVIKWWKTKTTISPNQKDVTRLSIYVKQFQMHLVHYLQVSKVVIDSFSFPIYFML
jgi:hypothetical protein